MFRSFEVGFPSGQRDQTVNLTRKLRWFESTPLHHLMVASLRLEFECEVSDVD